MYNKCSVLVFLFLFINNYNFISGNKISWIACTEDKDCPTTDSKCVENLCECPLGSVYNTESTLCLPIIAQYGADCTDKNQCQYLLGEYECSNEYGCVCAKGWKYLFGKCMKIAPLGSTCERDEQCFDEVDFDTMFCDNGICNCKDTHYKRGDFDCRRKAALNETCGIDLDCHCENCYCDKTCKLNTTTIEDIKYKSSKFNSMIGYERKIEENINIRAPAKELDPCEDDQHCIDTYNNAICYPLTKKCVCKRGYFLIGRAPFTCEKELHNECQATEECLVSGSRCFENRCKCNPDRMPALDNTQCKIVPVAPAMRCSDTFKEECFSYGPNGVCNAEKVCSCSLDSIFNSEFHYCEENTKIPGICVQPSDCNDIPNSECNSNGKCVCKKDYIDDGTLNCLKKATAVGGECTISLQCLDLPNTECLEGACGCTQNSTLLQDTCHENKFIGSKCNRVEECHITLHTSTECRNGKCQCPFDTTYDDKVGCKSGAFILFSSYIVVLATILTSYILI